jgi:hypothetical protein
MGNIKSTKYFSNHWGIASLFLSFFSHNSFAWDCEDLLKSDATEWMALPMHIDLKKGYVYDKKKQ